MSKITLCKDSESIKYLCNKDKRLSKVISMVGDIEYDLHDNYYSFLIHEIIEQMLSIKAGAKIYARLEELCDNNICHETINNLTDIEIKSIGTANSKVRAIRDLTNSVISGELSLDEFPMLPDDFVIKKLTAIYGIGTWTAKMFLIFCLNRPNILPFEDIAFLQGYKWIYNTADISKNSVIKKCRKWAPYSSIAARYLYRAVDMGLTKESFHLFK